MSVSVASRKSFGHASVTSRKSKSFWNAPWMTSHGSDESIEGLSVEDDEENRHHANSNDDGTKLSSRSRKLGNDQGSFAYDDADDHSSFYDEDDHDSVSAPGSRGRRRRRRRGSRASNGSSNGNWFERSTKRSKLRNGTTIHIARQLLSTIFFYMAIAAPIAVLAIMRMREVRLMESTFASLADQTMDALSGKLLEFVETLDSISVMATSQAIVVDCEWPYLQLWDFDFVGTAALRSSEAMFIGFHPKIEFGTGESSSILGLENDGTVQHGIDSNSTINGTTLVLNHELWEQYVLQNDGWIQQYAQRSGRRSLQDSNSSTESKPYPPFLWTLDPEYGVIKDITMLPADDSNSVPYLYATWQTAPVNPRLINLNMVTSSPTRAGVFTLLEQQRVAVLDAIDEYDESDQSFADFHTGLLRARYPNDPSITYQGEPSSWMYYPIFEDFNTDNDRKIVGLVSGLIYWERFFENLLPPRTQNGIVAVLETSCGGNANFITIEVTGKGSRFLGRANLHDRGYNYLERTLHLKDVFASTSVSNDPCNYEVHFFPTDDLQSSFVTLTPLFTAISVMVFFMIIILASISYDWMVQQRLKRIIKKSQADQQIVESIFPKQFRSKLLGGKKTPKQKAEAAPAAATAATTAVGGLRNKFNMKKSGDQQQIDPVHSLSAPSFHPTDQLKSFLHDVEPSANQGDGSSSRRSVKPEEDYSNGGDDERLDEEMKEILSYQPIASLFPACTVLFADVAGFSAWSSEREPEHVFLLLETLFQTLDRLARKRRVFKVETIGDSYMAVTGLPDPQKDHAVRMARFARDCMTHTHQETKQLETTLGPDTGDLRLRVGMNSGPVTAGVLRGQKARFQLFGDTVNTASRMESSSISNRIQLSESTANLVIAAGKAMWVKQRTDVVHAKGKGALKTYWLALQQRTTEYSGVASLTTASISSSGSSLNTKDVESSDDDGSIGSVDRPTISSLRNMAKNSRMIDWLSDILMAYLRKIEAQREDFTVEQAARLEIIGRPDEHLRMGEMVLDEVAEAFTNMPTHTSKKTDPESIRLSDEVIDQVREYVRTISSLYRKNPFHNFDHCSHVTQSAQKLLKRIVNPGGSRDKKKKNGGANNVKAKRELYCQTYGIAADALAQFAVVFCSVIHDVDHTGVPNGQLIKENPVLGIRYKDQSVAEQHSVDISWDLLMQPQFADLQKCIFINQAELRRFRQYIVNMVMATDIFNPRMKSLRNQRWERVFPAAADDAASGASQSQDQEKASREVVPASIDKSTPYKATIVLEHIIQAADVSHTMQHWNVYKKWNERLFCEMYAAYKAGRADRDPSVGWYQGELWFFDNYIIPLARKLEHCGVFGVSSDECLNYALDNRKEWETKGEQIIKDMVAALREPSRVVQPTKTKIGGYDPRDIETLQPDALAKTIKDLIRKGRFLGTFKSEGMRDGQIRAAKSWMEALHLYEVCPASASLPDPSSVLSVYSGILVFLKGGILLQDTMGNFEWNLVSRFVKESKRDGSTVHIARALAAQSEVMARRGDFVGALNVFKSLTVIYDPKEHSAAICKIYGTDRVAQIFAQRANWLDFMGKSDASLSACHRVLKDILPHMDPKNVLNTFELLYPLLPLLKKHGAATQVRNVFSKNVVDNFAKYKLVTTMCRPMFLPILMVLDLCSEDLEEREKKTEGILNWLTAKIESDGDDEDDDDNSDDSNADGNEHSKLAVDPFLDNFYGRVGWSPNSIMTEICLKVAKYLISSRPPSQKEAESAEITAETSNLSESGEGDASNEDIKHSNHMIRILLKHALILSQKVEQVHRYHIAPSKGNVDDGAKNDSVSIAFQCHEPIMNELIEITEAELGSSVVSRYTASTENDTAQGKSLRRIASPQYAMEVELGVLQLAAA